MATPPPPQTSASRRLPSISCSWCNTNQPVNEQLNLWSYLICRPFQLTKIIFYVTRTCVDFHRKKLRHVVEYKFCWLVKNKNNPRNHKKLYLFIKITKIYNQKWVCNLLNYGANVESVYILEIIYHISNLAFRHLNIIRQEKDWSRW